MKEDVEGGDEERGEGRLTLVVEELGEGGVAGNAQRG